MLLYRHYAAQIQQTLDRMPWDQISRVVDALYEAWSEDRTVYVMGNGGSAATALHMACDLGKNTAQNGLRRLRVLSLTDNMALFSAHANDDGYEHVFAEQLANFARTGDVVVAISASGNSPNVLNGVTTARDRGAVTIGWSGYTGGRLANMVDIPLVVPNHNIEQIEDIHMMLEHMVTVGLRQRLQHEAHTPMLQPAVLHRSPPVRASAT